MAAIAMADTNGGNGFLKVNTALSLPDLLKWGAFVGIIVGAFWVIVLGVKDNINTEARALRDSIVAESKANSGSIYNLQVDLAVQKSKADQISAQVTQIREEDRQRTVAIQAQLDKIMATVTAIQIGLASIDNKAGARSNR